MAALQQLKLLINLANIDGEIGERERKYILNIGTAHGFLVAEILPMFSQEHRLVIPDDLSDDERFDYSVSLIQLMKIDERLYEEEIKYCAKVVARLGYREEFLFELMLHVSSTPLDEATLARLKEAAKKFSV